MKFYLVILVIACFSFTACIDEIEVPLSNDSSLVIDGWITDELGPHKITIAQAYSFNENPVFAAIDPIVLNAAVEIFDDENNTITLSEGRNGNYYTPPTFAAVIGRSYTLKVTLNNGEVFLSKPEKVEPLSATIDEVCFENTVRQVSTGESITEEREVEFTISFTDQTETRSYYRWGYNAVYEIQAPLAASTAPCNPEAAPDKCGPCLNPVQTCWATTFDTEFLKVDSDELFNGKSVENYRIYSTSADRKFDITYAANIEQYSLTQEAYQYYDAIERQLGNTGTIFEAPNYQIRGNIVSEDDPDRLILGYFGASAKATARVIVDDNDVPGNFGPIDCTPSDAGCIPATCIDCRKWPATNVKPFYWP